MKWLAVLSFFVLMTLALGTVTVERMTAASQIFETQKNLEPQDWFISQYPRLFGEIKNVAASIQDPKLTMTTATTADILNFLERVCQKVNLSELNKVQIIGVARMLSDIQHDYYKTESERSEAKELWKWKLATVEEQQAILGDRIPILLTNPTNDKLMVAGQIFETQTRFEEKNLNFAEKYPEIFKVIRHIAERIPEPKISAMITTAAEIFGFLEMVCKKLSQMLSVKTKNELTTVSLIVSNIQLNLFLNALTQPNSSRAILSTALISLKEMQNILDPTGEFRFKVTID